MKQKKQSTDLSATFENIYACNWELTLACSLKCLHCGSQAGTARKNELSISECFTVAQQLYELGCKEITFIGGEVFLYRGWEKLTKFVSEKGIIVNIVSNGFTIGAKELRQLKESQIINIGISLDGMEYNHNKIRNNTRCFARVEKSIQLLTKNKIPVGVITSLLDCNYYDLENIYTFLLQNKVSVWQLQIAAPMGNMKKKFLTVLDPQKVPMVTEFIRNKNSEQNILLIGADSIGYYDDNEVHIRGYSSPLCYWNGCKAGITSIFIDSIGNVKGCGALYDDKFIEGNVRKQSLKEIWQNKNTFLYNRNFSCKKLTGFCKKCDVNEICKGGCRALNFFSNNTLYQSKYCSKMITMKTEKSSSHNILQ